MESENGVAVEEEKRVIGVTTKENIKNEVGNGCNDEEIQTKSELSKPIVESERPNSAGETDAVEASITSSASNNSKPAKVPYTTYQNCLFKLLFW